MVRSMLNMGAWSDATDPFFREQMNLFISARKSLFPLGHVVPNDEFFDVSKKHPCGNTRIMLCVFLDTHTWKVIGC